MEKHARIITPMPPALVGEIDDYKFSKRRSSRADATRNLIALGLHASRLGVQLPNGSALSETVSPEADRLAEVSEREIEGTVA